MTSTEKKGIFRYENFMLITMFLTFGLIFMDRFGLAMLFPMIAPELKLTGTQIGMTMSILALCWGVSSYLFSTLSDLFGSKKKILAIAILVFSIATMGTGLASSFGMLLLMRAIMGIAEGPAGILCQVSMMAESTPKRRGFNIGFVQSASNLVGTSLAAVIVIGSAELFGWRGAMNVLAVPGIILGLILLIFMREPVMDPESNKRPTRAQYAQIFKSRNVWLCLIMSFGMMAWWLTNITYFSLYLTKVNNFTPVQLGIFFTVYGILNFVAAILVPMISDKIGRKPATIVGTFGALLSSIVMLTVHSFDVLIPVMGIILLFGAGAIPLIMAVIPGESVPKTLIASAMGLIMMFGELVAGTTVPILAGFFSDKYGISMAMWFALGGAVIQFIPSFFLKETAPAKLRQAQQINQVEANPIVMRD
ncbi:MAG: MFS transporter [Clostridia bacterium]|nr:MFS transporter [Clostridia bacterium]